MGERRIVLDTSVLIAGIIGHGASSEILDKIISCEIIPVLSKEIIITHIREHLKNRGLLL